MACFILIVVTLAALAGGSAIYTANRLREEIELMSIDCIPGLALAGRMESSSESIERAILQHIASTSPTEKQEAERAIAERTTALDKAMREYDGTITMEEDRRLFAGMAAPLRLMGISFREDVLEASRANRGAEAVGAHWKRGWGAYRDLRTVAGRVLDWNQQNSDRVVRVAREAASQGYRRAWWISIFSVLACVGLGIWVARQTTQMTSLLTGVATRVKGGMDQLIAAAQQIAEASRGLADDASNQAASIEETSAGSHRIHDVSKENAQSVRAAEVLIRQVNEVLGEASRGMDGMGGAMRAIEVSGAKVASIIKVIDGIAFQTNILALNAAVEAARAGESGLGFAVVADEVRNLAQRAAKAAQETAILIDESVNLSAEGGRSLSQVSTSVGKVTDRIGKLEAILALVVKGGIEQARGFHEINVALQQMSQLTQATAAHAEESSASSEVMFSQVRGLREEADLLGTLVHAEG